MRGDVSSAVYLGLDEHTGGPWGPNCGSEVAHMQLEGREPVTGKSLDQTPAHKQMKLETVPLPLPGGPQSSPGLLAVGVSTQQNMHLVSQHNICLLL